MSWNFAASRLHAFLNDSAEHPQSTGAELSIRVQHGTVSLFSSHGDRGRLESVKARRRRVLLRKGARIHLGMLRDADDCSMAILDPSGMVVCWYGRSGDHERTNAPVLDQHVSQFYINLDVASSLPQRHLHTAAQVGTSVQEGWRVSASGRTFWGVTDIRVMTHRDGRVQGFVHVIRPGGGPWSKMLAVSRRPSPRLSDAIRTPQESFGIAACSAC